MTAGLADAPEWLETDWTFEQFGGRRGKSIEAYQRFVAEGTEARYEP